MSEGQVFLLRCPCGAPIVLPRQSPLGRYEGQHYQPTDAWPVLFVCTHCERQSVHRPPTRQETLDDNLAQYLRRHTFWRFEIECDHENCGELLVIHTISEADALDIDVLPAVRRIVPPTHAHLDRTGNPPFLSERIRVGRFGYNEPSDLPENRIV